MDQWPLHFGVSIILFFFAATATAAAFLQKSYLPAIVTKDIVGEITRDGHVDITER